MRLFLPLCCGLLLFACAKKKTESEPKETACIGTECENSENPDIGDIDIQPNNPKSCAKNFVKAEDGECLETCKALSCKKTEYCIEQQKDEAAHCEPLVQFGSCEAVQPCNDNEARDAQGACISCGELDCTSDPRFTGDIYPMVANDGRCVCELKPEVKAFYNIATHKTEACDADGDGWLTVSAKATIEACEQGKPSCNCVVEQSNHCEVNSIDAIVLRGDEKNVLGQAFERRIELLEEEKLAPYLRDGKFLDLYETDANDDLAQRTTKEILPMYGSVDAPSRGRLFKASELNGFTKACVSATADFNGNKLADVAEYQGQKPSEEIDGWLSPFSFFSYFSELYTGELVKRADGGAEYVIRERARLAANNGVPFDWQNIDNYARQCHRNVDALFANVSDDETKSQTGLDFARYNSASAMIAEFGHHSQFRCVQVVDAPKVATELPVQQITQADKNKHSLQACALNANTLAFECSAVHENMWKTKFVGWSIAKYQTVDAGHAYQRGCIDECKNSFVAEKDLCPERGKSICVADANRFGKLQCACDTAHFTGADCKTECGSWWFDNDNDGFVNLARTSVKQCESPAPLGKWVQNTTRSEASTCDDNASVSPNQPELCDEVDNNCDGKVDEIFTNKGAACDNGLKGACRETGTTTCSDDKRGMVCDTFPRSAMMKALMYAQAMTQDVNEGYKEGLDTNCDGKVSLLYPTSGALNDKLMIAIKAFTLGTQWVITYDQEALCQQANPYGVTKFNNNAEKCMGVLGNGVHYFSRDVQDKLRCDAKIYQVKCVWVAGGCHADTFYHGSEQGYDDFGRPRVVFPTMEFDEIKAQAQRSYDLEQKCQ